MRLGKKKQWVEYLTAEERQRLQDAMSKVDDAHHEWKHNYWLVDEILRQGRARARQQAHKEAAE